MRVPHLLLAGVLTACATAKPVPERACTGYASPTDAPRGSYPGDRFFVGVGAATGVRKAADREAPARAAALADIGRQIYSEAESRASLSGTADGRTGERERAVFDAQVRSGRVSIPGAQVVARCFDEDSDTLYALVAVEKSELATRLEAEIPVADAQARQAFETASRLEADRKLLDALTVARTALDLAGRARRNAAALRALAARDVPVTAPEVRIREQYGRLRDAVPVAVVPTGVAALDAALVQAVAEAGLVRGEESQAVLLVRARVEELGAADSAVLAGAAGARMRATIDIVRRDSGASISTVSAEAGAPGTSVDAARQAAADRLARMAADRVRFALDEIFWLK